MKTNSPPAPSLFAGAHKEGDVMRVYKKLQPSLWELVNSQGALFQLAETMRGVLSCSRNMYSTINKFV